MKHNGKRNNTQKRVIMGEDSYILQQYLEANNSASERAKTTFKRIDIPVNWNGNHKTSSWRV